MKNPNGFGSIVKLSGNRRKPYAVRKTIGWNEKGHPIYMMIGYYADRQQNGPQGTLERCQGHPKPVINQHSNTLNYYITFHTRKLKHIKCKKLSTTVDSDIQPKEQ